MNLICRVSGLTASEKPPKHQKQQNFIFTEKQNFLQNLLSDCVPAEVMTEEKNNKYEGFIQLTDKADPVDPKPNTMTQQVGGPDPERF